MVSVSSSLAENSGDKLKSRLIVFVILVLGLFVPCVSSAAACAFILKSGIVLCGMEWAYVFLRRSPDGSSMHELERAAWLVVGMSVWLIPSLARVDPSVHGVWPGHRVTVECLLIVVVVGDTAQLLAGRFFGTHKALPSLSPGKTWEGYAGGAVLAIGYACLFHSWPLRQACVAVFSGFAGDAYFSLAKRRLGVKDFSRALGSHGGFCDRCDSFIFAQNAIFALGAK